jgi:hypothetical protein
MGAIFAPEVAKFLHAAALVFELAVLFVVAWALVVWATHWVAGWYAGGRPCPRLCPRCGGCMTRRRAGGPWVCPLCLWKRGQSNDAG